MAPSRIQLSRRKGWRMPPGAVKVDRSTRWGNPFRIGDRGVPDAAVALAKFHEALADDERAADVLGYTRRDVAAELAGHDLACWCAPGAPCHGDLLLRVANNGGRVPKPRVLPAGEHRSSKSKT